VHGHHQLEAVTVLQFLFEFFPCDQVHDNSPFAQGARPPIADPAPNLADMLAQS
jgi:hypothetical protein